MTTNSPLPPLGHADRDWSRVLVIGLGLSGRAAAELLVARGVDTWGADRRGPEALDLGGLEDAAHRGQAAFHWMHDTAALPAGVDGVVVSPGIAAGHPLWVAARAAGLPVIGEVELAFPLLDGPVVGVTGSNGKSTTTSLTGALLKAAGFEVEVCGNIGTPVSARVRPPGPPGAAGPERVFVIELSSFQLETIETFRPRAAAILNLSPDHLDRHGDLETYLAAKRAITRNQRAGDVLVLNGDDPRVASTASQARRRHFARQREVEDGCTVKEGQVRDSDGTALFRIDEVPLPGPHNLENAMAAALLARALGAEPGAIREGLRGFRALPHRTERFEGAGGVDFVDDSKGTNLDSTSRALEGFADRSVHLILGGRDKGADFAEIAAVVLRKARRVYLIGESMERIAARLDPSTELERSVTLDRAVASAISSATPGDTVLLSPACASFDQFRDYNHRGDEFQRLVRAALHAAGGEGR